MVLDQLDHLGGGRTGHPHRGQLAGQRGLHRAEHHRRLPPLIGEGDEVRLRQELCTQGARQPGDPGTRGAVSRTDLPHTGEKPLDEQVDS